MYRLRVLGAISLEDAAGAEVDALLRQPKHMAVLAYLATPKPGIWHRRDALLGAFWPELDQSKARTALRSALHTLRRHLPEGTVRTRGDDEVSLDPALISTDAAAMEEQISAGRYDEALAHYGGEFLSSLHIADAEEFEKWQAAQRGRLKSQAQKAAAQLAERRFDAGDLPGAIDAARRAAEIDPDDEVAARRWIAFLDRAGDRSQAFAVYERFRDHVAQQFGVRPSAETVALVDAIRTRRSTGVPLPEQPAPEVSATRSGQDDIAPVFAAPVVAKHRHRIKPGWVLGIGGAAAGIVLLLFLRQQGELKAMRASVGEGATATRSLVVLPMENETNDSKTDYIAAGLAEGIARRLEGMGGMTVRSGARGEWPDAVRNDYKTISRQFGSTILLRTKLKRSGDKLELHAAVLDVETLGERAIAPRRFVISEIRNVESEAAAAIAGEIFRTPLPTVPRGRDRAVDPESYRLMLDGWHQLMTVRDFVAAKRLFELALTRDPSNSRAWSGLSSAWAIDASSERIPFDDAFRRSTAASERALAFDSLDGTALANLGLLKALRHRNLGIGLELIRKAIAADPGNPEVFVIASHLYRSAWQWTEARDAIRVARRLDPLTPYHVQREATIELCADNAEGALRLLDAELRAEPENVSAREDKIRALVRAGRADAAIAEWRRLARQIGDTAIVRVLGTATGDSGYWRAKWVEGRRKAAAMGLRPDEASTEVQRARLQFEAGDLEGGYRTLDDLVREKNVVLYRLPCLPWLDAVRGTPRLIAIMKRVGSMPTN